MSGTFPPYLKIILVMAILAFVPFAANSVGEAQYPSAKHSASEIIKTPVVQSKLHKGEKIIWSSNTDLKKAAQRAVPVGLIGIVAILMAVQSMSLASRGSAGKLWFVFSIPFLVLGLYMLTAPYWTWRNYGDNVCLLTDKRAIEIVSGSVCCDEPYSGQMFEPLIYKYSADRADVLFYVDPTSSDGDTTVKAGFNGIENGDECAKTLKSKLADFKKVK